ncbi:MAG: 2-isopropylmalate synthase [Candidatus Excrementavichristensenella sp.]|jgi:2-isopropylmalate synthase
MDTAKYTPFKRTALPGRTWPDRVITQAPIWCSVDLRDGNQALPEPMDLDEKMAFFQELVRLGFKEIEIGFPAASQVEFEFTRALIERNMIPEDVTVQVLTQSREHLIRRTFQALEGCQNAIVHLYTNISPFFRQVVYRNTLEGVTQMAEKGAGLMTELAASRTDGGSGIRFEFSPESFSGSDPDISVMLCERMLDVFGATPERPLILNLPATVETASPNYFADQVEYFIGRLKDRDRAIISVHTHNDRGTAVASSELALLAGAQRVEGTLFGNGERTGNCDLITMALNLYTQGIDPGLDLSQLMKTRTIYENLTGMQVGERMPYSGDLVFTAFSGSHQDAIKKGFDYRSEHALPVWNMPYLVVDPTDIGRSYEPIIRINSQSGKGGAAYILQRRFGYHLPKNMYADFGAAVKRETDRLGKELSADQLLRLFLQEYCVTDSPYRLLSHEISERGTAGHSMVRFSGLIAYRNRKYTLKGEGNGPIDAFFNAMQQAHIDGFSFMGYHEHAIGEGSSAKAVAYIQLAYGGNQVFGVGIESNVSIASIKGIISAINRALTQEGK